ncbi:hypothetical protein F4680DRAFT_147747 [Xylaria scruposa]|nr:hypothetical protein F4680DRAFT_147747 [Xylaria scruposa]
MSRVLLLAGQLIDCLVRLLACAIICTFIFLSSIFYLFFFFFFFFLDRTYIPTATVICSILRINIYPRAV